MGRCRRKAPATQAFHYCISRQHRRICGHRGHLLPRIRLLDLLLTLNLLLTRTELVLQVLVQRVRIHIGRPPLTPTREEDLVRVFWDVIAEERPQDTSSALGEEKLESVLFRLSSSRTVRVSGSLTFVNRLCIRHVKRQLHPGPSTDICPRDKTGRDGHDVALAEELAAPPVGAEELRELGIRVDRVARGARAGLHLALDHGGVRDAADGPGGDENHSRMRLDELILQLVNEVMSRWE